MKELVARAIASRVTDGELIGIGAGSTVELAILAIGERIRKEGIRVYGVPSSQRTALKAAAMGIEVVSPLPHRELSWSFDGADEVDASYNMIKGGGGAMLNEKLVAKRSKHRVILVTEEKIVKVLGEKFPMPVEVVPEALEFAREGLLDLGAKEVGLREAENKYGPVLTEHHNFVVDARFPRVTPEMEAQIKQITGVVESGLFIGLCDELLVARGGEVFSSGPGQQEKKIFQS